MRKINMLAMAALAAGAIACGGGGGDDDNDDVAIPTDQAKDAAPAAAAMGKSVRDGKFEFVVTKLDCSKTKIGTDLVGTTAQGKFCMVTVSIKNIGKEAQLFDASLQKLLDAKGVTYDADPTAAIYVNKNAETFLNNINPGNQVTGVVPFDVPKTATITTLELHDGLFSDGVLVKVG